MDSTFKIAAEFASVVALSVSKIIVFLVDIHLGFICKVVAVLRSNLGGDFLKLCADFIGGSAKIFLKVAANLCSVLVGLVAKLRARLVKFLR